MKKIFLLVTSILFLSTGCHSNTVVNNPDQVKATTQSKNPVSETPPNSLNANLQTYTDSKYKFEFKYPKNLYTKTNDSAFNHTFRISNTSLPIYDGGGVKPSGVEGKDWIPGYEIYVGLQDVKNVSLVSSEYYVVKKLNLPQIEAYEISGDSPSSGPDVFIKNPNLPNSFIEVSYNNGLPDASEADKVFNQILSTFKFK
ncbi:MAG: hypothetical protein JWO40_23 [Candidatus Doudnabacteria bacterium]|nr:hypothetical protein [Candidatus Doudnabacteria bacterium]